MVAAAGRRRPSTFALVGATGKGNVRRRRDGDVWGATSGDRVHLYGARGRPATILAEGLGLSRTVRGGWRRTDVTGEALIQEQRSGAVATLATYRGGGVATLASGGW